MNWNQHVENRNAFPPDELKQYFGRHVAWNLDGTRIVASGDSDRQVVEAAVVAGYPSDQVVLSYVPNPDEILIGGVFIPVKEDGC